MATTRAASIRQRQGAPAGRLRQVPVTRRARPTGAAPLGSTSTVVSGSGRQPMQQAASGTSSRGPGAGNASPSSVTCSPSAGRARPRSNAFQSSAMMRVPPVSGPEP
ncbi:hypothetical protein [Rhodovarius lipocyclicus]|uniref:hypothetical protein n=1 Tax=Rhodovarius lipocyclicus TaxID=268410 RepID=UPI00135A1463|nr:hypothetical protein [Rhodovarius lipocyclicus]